jgi:hypothetical protein
VRRSVAGRVSLAPATELAVAVVLVEINFEDRNLGSIDGRIRVVHEG